MEVFEHIKVCFAKYAAFSGRASRPEFWWFALFYFFGQYVSVLVSPSLHTAFILLTSVPYLAVGWRRLHDSGRSGWFFGAANALIYLTGLMFFFGLLQAYFGDAAFFLYVALVLVLPVAVVFAANVWWLTRPGDHSSNKYGDPPTKLA